MSRDIVHKSDDGGVRLDLRHEEDVHSAFDGMKTNLAKRGLTEKMEAAVVQEMVTGGVETYVGMTEAAGFGAIVGFGIGGINVELWKDVAFRVHPLTDIDARDMLEQIRGKALLDGFRGAPPADRDALVDTILRVDRMVGDNPDIQELDINPLTALAPGHGAIAVDARIRIDKRLA